MKKKDCNNCINGQKASFSLGAGLGPRMEPWEEHTTGCTKGHLDNIKKTLSNEWYEERRKITKNCKDFHIG